MTRKKLEILSKANFGEVSNENLTPIESICINANRRDIGCPEQYN